MSFYDFDTDILGKQLLPPQLRRTKFLAWLKVLLKPLQWKRDVFFDSYAAGSSDPFFDSSNSYSTPDRVVMSDNSVWESLNTSPTLGSVSSPFITPDEWVKVQDIYIGVDERRKYNAQIIVLEHALNRWFQNPNNPQIYVGNNTVTNHFLMGASSSTSSTMPVLSAFVSDYMNDSYSPIAYNFTVYVPAALFATLGTTTQNRENAIRNIVDKYCVAGILYEVTTF